MRKGQLLLWLLALGGLVAAIPRVVPGRKQQDASSEDRDAAASNSPTHSAASTSKKFTARGPKASAHDPAVIAAALGSADTKEAALALDVLLPDLMKRDIAAAAELAQGLEPWAQREQALLRVADAWAATDADAAAKWCRGLGDTEERLHCLSAICAKLATTDPAKAVALAEPAGEPLQASLAAAWMARDPAAAAAWIEASSDSGFRDLCWSTSLAELARNSPGKAATLAADRIASGDLQEEAVISVLHQWVLQDRKAAAEWVELFPEGPLRDRAKGELSGSH